MKALSIKSPWAEMILVGEKTIETRTWRTDYRGELLLCCSKTPCRGWLVPFAEIPDIRGKAFAVCRLVDIHPMTLEDTRWARCGRYPGAYSWVLKDVEAITPFSLSGRLGLFNVDYNKRQSSPTKDGGRKK